MTSDYFKKHHFPSIPNEPGIYRFIGNDEVILYVGKAKNLKKRLSSYFTKNHDSFKTKILVKNAKDIVFTVVHTEQDALLLESTLIKKHQPRYNVMLKDGKSYAYIRIRKEAFPRVEFTRKVIRDGSTYFGPYTSKHRANVLLELIKQLFQVRTCKLNLSQKNIESGKFSVCLEYHIHNCKGPCVGEENSEEYDEKIAQIKNILRGNFKTVREYIHERMLFFSEHMEFEQAQEWKEKLDALTDYQSKSTVVSPKLLDLDVFSIDTDDKTAYVNYIKIVHGSIIHTETVEITKNLTDSREDILRFAISELRDKYRSIAPEIILPFRMRLLDPEIKITVPKIGDKKQLLDMSEKNTKYYLLQKKKQEASQTKKQTSAERILKTMRDDLQMEEIPFHLECFDNSNLQGDQPVASCVVFKNAKPSKKDYRHFNIKTVKGINDFASMEEIIYRRYSRLLKEEEPLPQLVIIDGGKGQLSAAMKSIRKLDLEDKITVVGIAKRLEEIYFPDDAVPLHINKKSESLKVIQQARNEAHRFAITFHRNRRSKEFLHIGLSDIKGLGPKSVQKLLRHFKSVERIAQASEEDIAILIGPALAAKIKAHFDDQNKEA
jgi:excinuclease ABC subunit C